MFSALFAYYASILSACNSYLALSGLIILMPFTLLIALIIFCFADGYNLRSSSYFLLTQSTSSEYMELLSFGLRAYHVCSSVYSAYFATGSVSSGIGATWLFFFIITLSSAAVISAWLFFSLDVAISFCYACFSLSFCAGTIGDGTSASLWSSYCFRLPKKPMLLECCSTSREEKCCEYIESTITLFIRFYIIILN